MKTIINGILAFTFAFAFIFLWGGISDKIDFDVQILLGIILFTGFLCFVKPFFYPVQKRRRNLNIKKKIQYIFNTK